ncbi:MAG TPA: hybrid sensor histidine kinase/response regulator [Pyrinomonadaceae bacterium]|nr:hybrid sensor histidine kinase/response regulator [Pyrinomonadaceae bacterium]
MNEEKFDGSERRVSSDQPEARSDAEMEIKRLKSNFVNTLVRDIRIPLTSVLGLLELFESKLQAREPFDAEDRQLLSLAIESGDRMRRVLDEHLEVAQQHERPMALKLEDVDALGLIEEVAEPLRGFAALRGVEMDIHASPRALSMRVDERETRRAFQYLLTCALSSTPDGGTVRIEAQALSGTRAGDAGRSFVLISITDSGGGIAPEELPLVFDAFHISRDAHGCETSGIGLAIAKRVAAAHGGNVAVRSQAGKGTTYSLVLPAAHVESAHDGARILIVEDAPELLLLLRKLVGRMGFQVEIAQCASEALKILGGKHIDLLMTDWAMPGMDGGELIAALKVDENLRHIPTIVLTGHDTDHERTEAHAAGCDRFLVKPIMRDELQRAISELLAVNA